MAGSKKTETKKNDLSGSIDQLFGHMQTTVSTLLDKDEPRLFPSGVELITFSIGYKDYGVEFKIAGAKAPKLSILVDDDGETTITSIDES